MLDAPRAQLERVTSRLAQVSGLESRELASEVVAFSYVAVGAALEAALREATLTAVALLRRAQRSALSDEQLAAVAESSFTGFLAAEKSRGRHDIKRAMEARTTLIAELRDQGTGGPGISVLQKTGVPRPEHFRTFFQIATGGKDPRACDADPPLARLVGRVSQIAGPRNDFAHDCIDPIEHEFVAGRAGDLDGLPGRIEVLQGVVAELVALVDVLEQACVQLEVRMTVPTDAKDEGRGSTSLPNA